MEPNQNQFQNVKPIPAGSKRLTKPDSRYDIPWWTNPVGKGMYDLPINSAVGGTDKPSDGRTVIGRPKPNQGIKGTGGKTIGGENGIKITGMTPITGGPSILKTPTAPKIKGEGKTR